MVSGWRFKTSLHT